jgi:NADPH:quinone reductase-like Zn-dependent oxidoreductase
VRGAARYDLIFQLAGTLSPMVLRRVLSREGTLLVSSGESDGRWIGPVGRTIAATLLSPFASQRLLGFTVKPNSDDLLHLRQLLEKGSVMPVIDRSYPLGEVPAAIRYLEEGHARGKVVITV